MSTETVVPAVAATDLVAEAGRHLAAGDAQAALDALRPAAAHDASSLRLRFLTGLIGCLSTDHPDVAAHLKSQDTDQPRIVLASEEDIAPALQQQARQEKGRIVIPGSAVPDYGPPPSPAPQQTEQIRPPRAGQVRLPLLVWQYTHFTLAMVYPRGQGLSLLTVASQAVNLRCIS